MTARLFDPRLAIALAIIAVPADASAPEPEIVEDGTALDVVYWPTPQPIVDTMLVLAQVTASDSIYDLGCGDARSLVTAATRYRAHGFGYDINPERVRDSLANVKKSHVENLVEIRRADILTLDLSKADVVFLYLRPGLNARLLPQLEKLKPGARVVSHEFPVAGLKANALVKTIAPADRPPGTLPDLGDMLHPLYLYVAPFQRASAAP